MFITFTSLLTIKCIRNILKIRNIKYISILNKQRLLLVLNANQCTRIIQRKFREKIKEQKECPVSHELLVYPFISFKINNKFLYYDFKTIIEYFNKTRDFRDPLTRCFISDDNIEAINKLIRYYYGKNTNKVIISDTMIKNVELNIITFCLNDLASEINVNYKIDIEDIYSNFLPRIIYYIHKLKKNHSNRDSCIIITAFRENIKEDIVNIQPILEYIGLSLLFDL